MRGQRRAILFLLDGGNGGANAPLGQHPTLVRQAAYNLKFQPLVYFLCLVIVAEDIGGQS